MFEERLHDFTNHAADVHRGAAVIEEQTTNKDDQRLPDEEEANSDGGRTSRLMRGPALSLPLAARFIAFQKNQELYQ